MNKHEDKKTVLVVEDEQELADLYEIWVQSAGYKTHTAYTYEEAINLLDSLGDQIDAALLDRRLPGHNGDKVLEEIINRNIECGVSMVTAIPPEQDVLEMGFDKYTQKPMTKDELIETVEEIIEKK